MLLPALRQKTAGAVLGSALSGAGCPVGITSENSRKTAGAVLSSALSAFYRLYFRSVFYFCFLFSSRNIRDFIVGYARRNGNFLHRKNSVIIVRTPSFPVSACEDQCKGFCSTAFV